MKIAVCMKEVPDASSPKCIDPETMRLDRSGTGALNVFDTHALEEALRAKDTQETEVLVLSLGPDGAMESIRKALAMGADRALLVADDGASGSDLVATSKIIAAALAREEVDLVLFGQQSSDSDGAVLWAAVADRLELPMISQAASLELASDSATVKRQTEHGYDVIRAPLPCVIAISDAINEPRYPSLKGIMGAKKKPQDVVPLAEIGVDASEAGEQGSRTEVYALADPPPRGEIVKIVDEGGASAEEIVTYLVEKKLI